MEKDNVSTLMEFTFSFPVRGILFLSSLPLYVLFLLLRIVSSPPQPYNCPSSPDNSILLFKSQPAVEANITL